MTFQKHTALCTLKPEFDLLPPVKRPSEQRRTDVGMTTQQTKEQMEGFEQIVQFDLLRRTVSAVAGQPAE